MNRVVGADTLLCYSCTLRCQLSVDCYTTINALVALLIDQSSANKCINHRRTVNSQRTCEYTSPERYAGMTKDFVDNDERLRQYWCAWHLNRLFVRRNWSFRS